MVDWAGGFVALITFIGVIAGAFLAERLEDWWKG